MNKLIPYLLSLILVGVIYLSIINTLTLHQEKENKKLLTYIATTSNNIEMETDNIYSDVDR